jgi:hypothetical protein
VRSIINRLAARKDNMNITSALSISLEPCDIDQAIKDYILKENPELSGTHQINIDPKILEKISVMAYCYAKPYRKPQGEAINVPHGS